MVVLDKKVTTIRYVHYWLARSFSWVFPFAFFAAKLGITKQTSGVVMPVIVLGFFGVIKLASDIPGWISTWRPSFAKGIVKAIPKLLLFFILITAGVGLSYLFTQQIEINLYPYYEAVLVIFGGASVGSIFEAFHLKYKELDMIQRGYVLGVVNK